MSKGKIILGIIAIIVAVLVLYFIFAYEKVEYAEIQDKPHIKGNPEASVVLVEFSDFQCPACKSAEPMINDLLETYGDKLRFEYRHLPLTSIHTYAFGAAEASECAADQGKFWEYHDLLFKNQNSLKRSDLKLYAEQVSDLEVDLFYDCLDSDAKVDSVKEDLKEADLRGFNSTPTFILNGQPVQNWQTLPSMVEALVTPLVPMQENNASIATSSQEL